MKIRPLIEWRDLWVGLFWDDKKRRLYILPVPCFGVVIHFAAQPKCECSNELWHCDPECPVHRPAQPGKKEKK